MQEDSGSEVVQGVDTSKPEVKRNVAAQIYDELRAVQEDPVKTVLIGVGVGSTYYPQEDGSYKEVHVVKLGLDPFRIGVFEKRGFTNEDLASGIAQISEAKRDSEVELIERIPGTDGSDRAGLVYVAGTGKVIAPGENKVDYYPVELDSTYLDALRRLADLSKIPYKIRERFGSYRAFKNALGDRDTNGIDKSYNILAKDKKGSYPWVPFQARFYLKTFVEALDLDESGELGSLDSADWQIGKSLVDNTLQRMYKAQAEKRGVLNGSIPSVIPKIQKRSG